MTHIVTPFLRRPQFVLIGDNRSIAYKDMEGSELVDLIPAEVEDAYHFLSVVFEVKHAFYSVPDITTLGRFLYLIAQYVEIYNLKFLNILDPFSQTSHSDQKKYIKYIDKDVFDNLHNTMVMCVGKSAQEIRELELSPTTEVVRFIDKHINLPTQYGILNIVYRLFLPATVSSEKRRKHYLRLIAATNPTISSRAMMLLSDAKVPLAFVPGVSTDDMLDLVADSAPQMSFDLFSNQ